MTSLSRSEGFIGFERLRTFFVTTATIGSQPTKTPLLVLHGGPGDTHDYLQPLEALADGGRLVVFYDQVGCGRSSPASEIQTIDVDLFRRELKRVREELKLEEVIILGHSWGGMLALEHVIEGAAGVRAMVLAGAPASVPLWIEEVQQLRQGLPAEVNATIQHHEAAGSVDSPEYRQAVEVFNARHVCRLRPKPACLLRSEELAGTKVYRHMVGASEVTTTGVLTDWDITSRLPEILMPVMVTSGKYDEFTPRQARLLVDNIPHARWELFAHSAHMPHLEETDLYLATVQAFLEEVDSGR